MIKYLQSIISEQNEVKLDMRKQKCSGKIILKYLKLDNTQLNNP